MEEQLGFPTPSEGITRNMIAVGCAAMINYWGENVNRIVIQINVFCNRFCADRVFYFVHVYFVVLKVRMSVTVTETVMHKLMYMLLNGIGVLCIPLFLHLNILQCIADNSSFEVQL